MLNIEAASQTDCGMQQYYSMGENKSFDFTPIIYFQNSHKWTFEGRYNYEAPNTISAYAGKVYQKKSLFSYSINPVVGMVTGGFNGGSAGVNIDADFKKLSFSSQAQYSFSLEDKTQNFTYSWSELSFNLKKYVGGGLCLQQTGDYNNINTLDRGIFLKVTSNGWTMPLYLFQNPDKENYFILSLIYEWTQKHLIRKKNNKNNYQ
jgi:hypothetical protein